MCSAKMRSPRAAPRPGWTAPGAEDLQDGLGVELEAGELQAAPQRSCVTAGRRTGAARGHPLEQHVHRVGRGHDSSRRPFSTTVAPRDCVHATIGAAVARWGDVDAALRPAPRRVREVQERRGVGWRVCQSSSCEDARSSTWTVICTSRPRSAIRGRGRRARRARLRRSGSPWRSRRPVDRRSGRRTCTSWGRGSRGSTRGSRRRWRVDRGDEPGRHLHAVASNECDGRPR